MTGTTTIVLDTGITVTVGITAEVKGNLKPGMPVSVEGTLQPDGSIVAVEIKPGLGEGDDKGDGIDRGKGDDRWDVIAATLTITDDDHFGGGKGITGTGTISDDDKMITGTGTITNPDGIDGHKFFTGTLGDGKFKFPDGDKSGNPPGGNGPGNNVYGPFNGSGGNSGPHSNGNNNGTNGNGNGGSQSWDHPKNGNGGGGGSGDSNKGSRGTGKHG